MDKNRKNLLLWARKKANNPKLEDEGDFAYVLDQLEEVIDRNGVASESIADISQSFNGNMNQQMVGLLSPYRRAKFL